MIKKIFITILGIIKSIWNATTKIVWGISGIILLALLISNTSTSAIAITSLLNLSILLMDYWFVFWWAFFLGSLYNYIRMEFNT